MRGKRGRRGSLADEGWPTDEAGDHSRRESVRYSEHSQERYLISRSAAYRRPEAVEMETNSLLTEDTFMTSFFKLAPSEADIFLYFGASLCVAGIVVGILLLANVASVLDARRGRTQSSV